MFKLIKNELKKIFLRKSTYIFLVIIFIIIEISTAKERNTPLIANENDYEPSIYNEDVSTVEEIKNYLELKTNDSIPRNIRETYGAYSWQEYIILSEYKQLFINKLYPYTYIQTYNNFIKNKKDILKSNKISIEDIKYDYDEEKAKEEFDEINDIFKADDWKKVANIMLEKDKKQLDELESNKDLLIQEEYETQKEMIQKKIEEKEYRLEKNVRFGYDYLNIALDNRFSAIEQIRDYKKNVEKNMVSYTDKFCYQNAKETLARSNYVIDTRNDPESKFTIRDRVSDVFFDNILLVIMIIIVSSTIMSSEYGKDTMKQLLIKPYSRTEIFFGKLITCFIILILASIFTVLCTLISNIIWFGTDTLEIPMIIYNFSTDSIMEMSMLKYIIIQFMAKLPIYIGVIFIGFACSTVLKNSLVSFLIALLTYTRVFTSFLLPQTQESVAYNILLLTQNWDFSIYLFGKMAEYENFTIYKSVIICLIYFAIIMIPAFFYFKIADIKSK